MLSPDVPHTYAHMHTYIHIYTHIFMYILPNLSTYTPIPTDLHNYI